MKLAAIMVMHRPNFCQPCGPAGERPRSYQEAVLLLVRAEKNAILRGRRRSRQVHQARPHTAPRASTKAKDEIHACASESGRKLIERLRYARTRISNTLVQDRDARVCAQAPIRTKALDALHARVVARPPTRRIAAADVLHQRSQEDTMADEARAG